MKRFALKIDLPGSVAYFHVEDGDSVEEGDNVIAVECMKMNMDITAPVAGKVRFRVALGEMVEQGQVIAEIEQE